jgi:pimeloyl-ACP methyl ester carboxylesterase
MVAIRQRSQPDPYLAKIIPYAATGVLRPIRSDASTESGTSAQVRPVVYQEDRPTIARLDLYDPLRVTQYSDSDRCWDLARDVSAPLGFARSHLNRDNLKSFLHPGRDDEFSGLRMIEPYQPGKIPIVFVHGLLSDRLTWIDLINDLRDSPWFARRYQIWLYQYSTGDPFVISAAEMRQTLKSAVAELDPQGSDRALSEIVLVGHSMGGLVSKLLITQSGEELWNSIANRPIEQVKLDPESRSRLEAIFFFEPLPFVKRVVFIGSPHQGSSVATSWIGKLGSKLVRTESDRIKRTRTILHDNPHVFEGFEKHVPTSVDLLRPDNPILMATYRLPVNPEVRLHTIIGTGHKLRDGSDGDGVVPIESARLPGVDSELRIECSHTALPDDPKTTIELKRLLRESSPR